MTRPTRLASVLVPVLAAALVATAPAADAKPKRPKIAEGHYVGRELPRHTGDSTQKVRFSLDVTGGNRPSLKNVVVRFQAACGGYSGYTWQKVKLPIDSVSLDSRTGEFGSLTSIDVDDDSQDLRWSIHGVLVGSEVRAGYFWWSAGNCSRAVPESPVLWSARRVSKR